MESLTKKNNSKQIFFITAMLTVAAMVISFGSTVFADNGDEVASFRTMNTAIVKGSENVPRISLKEFVKNIGKDTGVYKMFFADTKANEESDVVAEENVISAETTETVAHAPANDFDASNVKGWQKLIMLAIGFLIVYLGAAKGFEPLLLIPIGFGTILVNIPGAGMGDAPHGMLHIIYNAGVGNEFFPMLIFMGIGAMTDFGPLIANPKTALLGGAAQLGIFFTLFGVALMNLIPGMDYNMLQACAIAIIGGADGPTSIYVSGKLAPEMMAVIAVAAYSYMALVPMIQPPIMKLLTTKKERLIKMEQLREVSKTEKILFPLVLLVITLLFLPPAAPLIGMLAFGNFIKELGTVERLSKTVQNEMMNIVSILLSLGVGSQMTPEKIMRAESLGIIVLGLVAFIIASAGVSAVPMAARVSNKVGLEEDPSNFLLMHAMGPNVAGVIGTAIAAGVFISTYGH